MSTGREGSNVSIGVAEIASTEQVTAPENQRPQIEDVFSDFSVGLRERVLGGIASGLEDLRSLGHHAVHGYYSPKFKKELRTRNCFETSDGVKLTARIFNPEFLENDEHAIVYSFSLCVPGGHGIEIPTLSDIAAHGESTGRAVIAITTEGLAGALSKDQLMTLLDFWNIPRRRFELLRKLLPPGKKLIVTGSSLGGMTSHGYGATWEEEAEKSDHLLEVTHVIAVASAGHHPYRLRHLPKLARQFTIQEGSSSIRYVKQGEGHFERLQRFFELVGTAPRHPSQLAAIGITAAAILRSPLEGVESRIPHTTKVVDITFGSDGVTHSRKRSELWQKSEHPDIGHAEFDACHVDGLLTIGREETLRALEMIPSVYQKENTVDD